MRTLLCQLFGEEREPLGVKLRRVIAADRVNGKHGERKPEPSSEGRRHLYAARTAASHAA